jgi:hypothetical protein
MQEEALKDWDCLYLLGIASQLHKEGGHKSKQLNMSKKDNQEE